MLDENGDILTEEKTVQIPMYKPVVVFDVQQTVGKPLPELAESLTGDVQNYEVFMEVLRRSAPVPICFEKMAENMDGYFSVDNQRIVLREGMSEVQSVCAAVYAGNLDRGGDTQDRLDELYETFNIRRPEDFRGHSLSVSDIVALKQNGVVSCHYVEPQGFRELPGFLKPENYLKNAEMAMEDDYGMIDGVINNGPKQTVAELEEQAKSGKPVSLMELAPDFDTDE